MKAPIRRVDHVDDNPIVRGRRTRKTIGQDLNFNGLPLGMIRDEMSWHHLIQVADPRLSKLDHTGQFDWSDR